MSEMDERHPKTGADGGPEAGLRLDGVLRALDPGSKDRGYWVRFHRVVMEAARDELARRRMTAEVTVSELVTSWARAVVPTALIAAAAAAFLLVQTGGPGAVATGEPLVLEEMFGPTLENGGADSEAGESGLDATFASEGF
jgi:hypothetical protein